MERAPSDEFESFSIIRFDSFAPTVVSQPRLHSFSRCSAVHSFTYTRQESPPRDRLRIRGMHPMHSVAAPPRSSPLNSNHPPNIPTICRRDACQRVALCRMHYHSTSLRHLINIAHTRLPMLTSSRPSTLKTLIPSPQRHRYESSTRPYLDVT